MVDFPPVGCACEADRGEKGVESSVCCRAEQPQNDQKPGAQAEKPVVQKRGASQLIRNVPALAYRVLFISPRVAREKPRPPRGQGTLLTHSLSETYPRAVPVIRGTLLTRFGTLLTRLVVIPRTLLTKLITKPNTLQLAPVSKVPLAFAENRLLYDRHG